MSYLPPGQMYKIINISHVTHEISRLETQTHMMSFIFLGRSVKGTCPALSQQLQLTARGF
jgi:hypothetical protein